MRTDLKNTKNKEINESSSDNAISEDNVKVQEQDIIEEDEEDVLFEMPPSGAIILMCVFFWIIILVFMWYWVPMAVMQLPNSNTLPSINLFGSTQVSLATLIAIGTSSVGVLHLLSLLMWRATTRYILTDEYLLVEKGILGKKGWALSIDDIIEIKYHRGLLGVIGSFGVIYLKIRNEDKILDLRAVPTVAAATRTILATRSKYRRTHNPFPRKTGKKKAAVKATA